MYIYMDTNTEHFTPLALHVRGNKRVHCCCFHGILTKLQFLLIEQSGETQLEIWVLTLDSFKHINVTRRSVEHRTRAANGAWLSKQTE